MSAKNGSIKLVAGNSNPALAQGIAQAGFSGLSNVIGGTPTDSPTTAPGLRGPAVASIPSPARDADLTTTALGYTDR